MSPEEVKLIKDTIEYYSEEEFDAVIWKEKSWPLLYHLSSYRKNIIEWVDIQNEDSVLEINCECGALTGILSGKAGRVHSIDADEQNVEIARMRMRNSKNVKLDVCSELELGNAIYNHIVFWDSPATNRIPLTQDNIKKIKRHLNPGGMVVVIARNPRGLKYWAGGKQSENQDFFASVEAVGDDARYGFSRKQLTKLLNDGGFPTVEFFYPYPDTNFPMTIFSDKRLPNIGELLTYQRNYESERLVLFDEERVFDKIIQDDTFPYFSNGYVVIASSEEVK